MKTTKLLESIMNRWEKSCNCEDIYRRLHKVDPACHPCNVYDDVFEDLSEVAQSAREEEKGATINELREIAEIYIGIEGGQAQTAPEAYLEAKLKEMHDEIQWLIKRLSNSTH